MGFLHGAHRDVQSAVLLLYLFIGFLKTIRFGGGRPVLRQKQIRPEALLNHSLSERDESG